VEAPSSIQRIEPFPGSALALLSLVTPQPGDVQQLAALFEQEPLLLAAVGKVAISSGAYIAGDPPDFRSMFEQVGSADLLKIAITLSIRGYMQRAFNVFEDRRYWFYTLACAVSCAEIAAPGKSAKLVAYVAGLLHDIGRLALIAAYPDKYANLLILADRMFREDPRFSLLDHERMLFGMDHFATGSWLATTWALPPWLRAITGKFSEAASGEHGELVATVRCGTGLAHSLGFGYLQAAPRAEVREILRRLPAAWARWQNLDHWKHGAEHVRAKIQSQLNLYAITMPENE
jgi:HD-like signal output (HDOD) protein